MIEVVKATLLFLSILLSISIFAFLRCIFVFSPALRKYFISYTVHIFGRILVSILNIKVKILGEKRFLKKRGIFFVSNHLSYIDGIVATSLTPLVFIGRMDLKTWPLFGLFSLLSDTIFVNRVNVSTIHKEIDSIVSFLNSRVNVILFPEGTSGNGEKVLPFKSSFFEVPLKAKCEVVPITIKYKEINSQGLDDKNKDLVYWYGDMDFFPHLIGVLKLRKIVVEVGVGKILEIPAPGNTKNSLQRKHLRDASQRVIENLILTS